MTVKTGVFGVTTTAQKINPDATDGVPGYSIAIANNSGSEVRIGGSDLTWANGWSIPTGTTYAFDATGVSSSLLSKPTTNEDLYIIAQGNVNVNWIATGV